MQMLGVYELGVQYSLKRKHFLCSCDIKYTYLELRSPSLLANELYYNTFRISQ